MGGTAQDVFAQLAAEQAARPPMGGGDVFAQIHAENQGVSPAQAIASGASPEQIQAATQNEAAGSRATIPQLLHQPAPVTPDNARTISLTGRVPTVQEQIAADAKAANTPKFLAPIAGSMAAPELAPEWLADSWLGHALITGVGGALGTSAGQAATGNNPVSARSLGETGTNALAFATLDGLFGAIPAIAQAKLGRSFVNESLGANAQDVVYGNPAKAIEREGILTPTTGDIEKVKAAGNDLTAAGGRLGEVASRVQQLQPQLNQALSRSTARLSVASTIDKPLTDAMNDIIDNSAMTDAEKMSAITQLGGLQSSLHQGIGADISPIQANQLKNLIGSRVRWTGTNAVGDEVKPAYKAVYVALKNAVNGAVPGVADLNERLTDLYAAQDDLLQLARREEVGRGMGMMRGTMGTSMIGRLEGEAGRFLPASANASRVAQVGSKFAVPALGSADNPDIHVENLPALLGGQQ